MNNEVFNVKCTPKIAYVEIQIKRLDNNIEDRSRAALLKRAISAASEVNDWALFYTDTVSKVTPTKETPVITGWQARYDKETGEKIIEIRNKMYNDLIKCGIITKVLQNQLFLLMILANYLEFLKRKAVVEKDKNPDKEEDMSIPEVAYTLAQLLITDPDSTAVKEIKSILAAWRKSYN